MIVDTTLRRIVQASAIAACIAMNAPLALAAGQPPAPDNTKVNQRDRKPSAVTADQQENNPSDVAVTRAIRQALMDDKGLSTYAHNVKVITRDGKVTLKGPVRTAEEKKSVEVKAAEVAGAENVTSRLSVATKKPNSKKAGS